MAGPAPEQIVAMLRERRSGTHPKRIAHQLGISKATLYRWLARYGQAAEDEVARLRRLNIELRALKRALARMERSIALMLDASALARDLENAAPPSPRPLKGRRPAGGSSGRSSGPGPARRRPGTR